MIRLQCTEPVLSRFASELAAEGPRLDLRPDLRGACPRDVEAARLAWAARIVDEYRSVVVFSELLTLLARLEMPYAALCAVSRLVDDELRHTRRCAEVVDWLGGMEDLEVDLEGLALPPTEHTTAGRAYAIVAREITVAERESVRVLVAFRDATTDAAVRKVLSELLADEVRHAAVGPRLESVMRRELPAEAFGAVLDEIDETLERDRQELRAFYREMAEGGPGRRFGASITREDLAS